MNNELKLALYEAIMKAINDVGLNAFKKISWFGSNDPAYKKRR